MSFLNKILEVKFRSRFKEVNFFKKNPQLAQEKLFFELINKAQNTKWGLKYNYSQISSKKFKEAYSIFKEGVPVSTYEQLFEDINIFCNGEKNVLWPGKIKWVAKSSGTTNSKSKIIPITLDSLKKCHYKVGQDVFSFYLKQRPDSKIFKGKTISIGGSFSSEKNKNNLEIGDLSAILIKNLPRWAKFFRSPKTEIALLDEWEKKLELMASSSIKQNIVALAGVPSWTLLFLNKVLELSKKDNILDVWPNLELFVHGGVSFLPYREQFKSIIPSKKMTYLETYNASEGFFAVNDDLNRDDMLLILDSGIFYEFIELSDLNNKKVRALNVAEVELGKTYALLISTNGGLWRYLIGDTVKITSLKPLRVKVAGRTKHFINVFGEELMVSNTDEAISLASGENSAIVMDYSVAPIFMNNSNCGAHQWLIEFKKKPVNTQKFIEDLDKYLKSLNSDYEAKRHSDLILSLPQLTIARSGLFYDWLKNKNKLGGQNKVPRLSNNRDFLEELLILNKNKNEEL